MCISGGFWGDGLLFQEYLVPAARVGSMWTDKRKPEINYITCTDKIHRQVIFHHTRQGRHLRKTNFKKAKKGAHLKIHNNTSPSLVFSVFCLFTGPPTNKVYIRFTCDMRWLVLEEIGKTSSHIVTCFSLKTGLSVVRIFGLWGFL